MIVVLQWKKEKNMDIVQFFALLSNIVTELRKKGENDKANELSGAMNK